MLPLALTQGDPAGVGPLATLLAWRKLRKTADCTFYLRGSPDILADRARAAGVEVPFADIQQPGDALSVFENALPILPLDTPSVSAGVPSIDTAASIIASIQECVQDLMSGKASAIVTNPIAKSLLKSAGFKHPGHTEFLAELAGRADDSPAPLPVMLLVGGGLRVALATIHMPLRAVPDALSTEHIQTVSRIVLEALPRLFGEHEARLGVCGLNPHAGEDGMLGAEDENIIKPAIHQLQYDGYAVTGPRPGDTVFHEMLEGRYDAVLAMYHDQGLIPVKTLDIWGGVNITLGLPFIRTSPDHGTAYDAAASGKVRPDSLIAALRQARQMATHKLDYDTAHDG